MKQVGKFESHPFITTDLNGLFEKLCYYIENQDELINVSKSARQWMERHWDPKRMVFRFINAYFDVMIKGEISNLKKEKIHKPPKEVPTTMDLEVNSNSKTSSRKKIDLINQMKGKSFKAHFNPMLGKKSIYFVRVHL